METVIDGKRYKLVPIEELGFPKPNGYNTYDSVINAKFSYGKGLAARTSTHEYWFHHNYQYLCPDGTYQTTAHYWESFEDMMMLGLATLCKIEKRH